MPFAADIVCLRRRPRAAALVPLLAALGLLVALFATPFRPAFAAGPVLQEVPGDELPKTFQPGKSYTLHLRYTDPNGDPIRAKDAAFIDEAPSGRIATPATDVEGGDTSKGVDLSWTINGLEQGSHKAYFEVHGLTATARYPTEGANYEFVVEALTTKYGILLVGVVICFVLIPWVSYMLFRMINGRGDPSQAARGGLLFGLLAFCALFIFEFASVYGALTYAILILGVLGAIVLLAGRRR